MKMRKWIPVISLSLGVVAPAAAEEPQPLPTWAGLKVEGDRTALVALLGASKHRHPIMRS